MSLGFHREKTIIQRLFQCYIPKGVHCTRLEGETRDSHGATWCCRLMQRTHRNETHPFSRRGYCNHMLYKLVQFFAFVLIRSRCLVRVAQQLRTPNATLAGHLRKAHCNSSRNVE